MYRRRFCIQRWPVDFGATLERSAVVRMDGRLMTRWGGGKWGRAGLQSALITPLERVADADYNPHFRPRTVSRYYRCMIDAGRLTRHKT